MATDITVTCKSIAEITAAGDGYNRKYRKLLVELADVEVDDELIDLVVEEFGVSETLERLSESDIIEWVERAGYTVERK